MKSEFGFHIMRAVRLEQGNLSIIQLILYGYMLHEMGDHQFCCSDKLLFLECLGKGKCVAQEEGRLENREYLRRRIVEYLPEERMDKLQQVVRRTGVLKKKSEMALTYFNEFLSSNTVFIIISTILFTYFIIR